jgi:hypothetical protein
MEIATGIAWSRASPSAYPSTAASADQVHGRERSAPYGFESLQVQCGGAIQPREALSEMAPHEGKMSRAWQLYTEFIGRAAAWADTYGTLGPYKSELRFFPSTLFVPYIIRKPRL